LRKLAVIALPPSNPKVLMMMLSKVLGRTISLTPALLTLRKQSADVTTSFPNPMRSGIEADATDEALREMLGSAFESRHCKRIVAMKCARRRQMRLP